MTRRLIDIARRIIENPPWGEQFYILLNKARYFRAIKLLAPEGNDPTRTD